MRLLLFFLGISLLSLSTPARAFTYITGFPLTDSLPPPPPGSPDTLTGPIDGCLGDTALYATHLPLGCLAEWYINDTLQGSDSSTMQVIWTDDGFYTISLYYDCDSGSSFVDSIETTVYDIPLKPGDIVGDDAVCEFTTHTYSTTVGLDEECEWYVAGELQSSVDTFMVYPFGEAGNYLIEVWAINNCGTSPQNSFLMVTATGLAPEPPDPIEGPEKSCVGYTETYTTVIGPDDDCQWKVDNIIQETTEPVLDVTWDTDGQHEIEARAVTDCGSSNPTTLEVAVYETPLVNLGNDTTIVEGQSIILDAQNTGSYYLWSTGDTTQTISVTLSGDYSVVVNNFCGEDTDSIFVDVIVSIPSLQEKYKLIVRNQGNLLFIEAPDQKMEELQIINLSGNVIYHGKGIPKFRLPGNGIYILKVRTDKAFFSRKILVFNK